MYQLVLGLCIAWDQKYTLSLSHRNVYTQAGCVNLKVFFIISLPFPQQPVHMRPQPAAFTTTTPTSPLCVLLLRCCFCCCFRWSRTRAVSALARACRARDWITTAAFSWSVGSDRDSLRMPALLLRLCLAPPGLLFSATALRAPAWRARDCIITAARSLSSCPESPPYACLDFRRCLLLSGVSGTKMPFALEYNTPSAKHGWRWCGAGKGGGRGAVAAARAEEAAPGCASFSSWLTSSSGGGAFSSATACGVET